MAEKRIDQWQLPVAAREPVESEPASLVEIVELIRSNIEQLRELEEALHSQGGELRAAPQLAVTEQDRYRSLFELAPDAYLVTDASGNILEANHAAVMLFDVPRRSLIGKDVASFVPSDERAGFLTQFRALAETRGVSEAEFRFFGRTRTIEISISAAPIRSGGVLEGFGWIVRDTTARKQAEREVRKLTLELEQRVTERTQELEDERARLHTIVEQMPVGLVMTNAAGQAVFMNRPAEELLVDLRSADESRFHRRFPAFRLNGDPYPENERPAARALRFGTTTTAERVYFERLDGTRVLFEISAAPIRDSSGRVNAATLTLQDLSGLEQRERSEREFVANAAHELRTPVAAVLSAIEVLQAGAKEEPRDRDLFLGHIEREAGRLGRLAHGLLVLARAQAGVESIKLQLVEIRPLLDGVAHALVAQEDVDVVVDCPPELRIWSAHDLLEQAVTSLAANAVAHTSKGHVTLAAHTTDSTIAIEVRDTGSGIAPSDQRRMFERFYPAGASREGFGLGLAIVRQAAEVLAAEIDVESALGAGTTIRLRLPAKLVA